MQEPFETKPDRGDELVATPEAPMPEPAVPGAEAPMREVAHAFRMNAEALHTLKEMQADLARQVRRGDRSELVVQSTDALNETFRNLSSVQQELLRRIHAGDAKRGNGPLVPLMLLGLLVVFLGCTWVVLDQLDRQKTAGGSELSSAEIVRRERDAWREGRNEGSRHADNEVKRLGDALDEAKTRERTLQTQMDARNQEIADLDRGKRAAEIERDEFAGQVRKAQSELMARQVLSEEISALKVELEGANRAAAKAEHEADLQRRKNAYLRERMADYGMGFSEDDPPYRPDGAPTAPDGMAPIVPKKSKLTNLDRLQEEMARRGMTPSATTGSASDAGTGPIDPTASSVPPPAQAADERTPAAAKPRRAAYGGDGPGMPPPAVLRGRRDIDANETSVERVRQHLNGLLRGSDAAGGAGWRITSLKQVAPDRLGGVVMVRYDAGGRMVETVEASEVRIAHDRTRKQVEFAFRSGERQVSGQRMQLPSVGSRVVVAEGQGADAWDGSSLRVIEKR